MKHPVKEGANFYDKLIKKDLIDPADKTADGGRHMRDLRIGTASFLTGPTSYIANVEKTLKRAR